MRRVTLLLTFVLFANLLLIFITAFADEGSSIMGGTRNCEEPVNIEITYCVE
jgi:hypothetical protein